MWQNQRVMRVQQARVVEKVELWSQILVVMGCKVLVAVGQEGFGSQVGDQDKLRLPCLIARESFPATLSLSSVTSFRCPFSFVSESPPPPNLVYGVCLVRKGLTLSNLRGSKNPTFCLPSPTVYDV